MKTILALFALLHNHQIPSQPQAQAHVLPTKGTCNIDLFQIDGNSFYADGMDLRPQQTYEPTLQTLQYIHDRHELLTRLTDFRTSFVLKEWLARDYLEEYTNIAPNVYEGGLLDDWDFDIL